jgi:hypothetical protein
MSDPFSPMFDKLAGNPDSLDGLVAYALYKKAKREWVIARRPSRPEIDAHHTTVTDSMPEMYRNEARGRMAAYAQGAIAEVANALRQEGAESEIVETVRKQQSFVRNLGVNLLGSLAFSILLFGVGLAVFAPDVPGLARRAAAPVVDAMR